MQLSSRILTALAVLILAVAVVAVRAGSTGTVDAATGTINVVNVGTCYTTDTDIFTVADCKDGQLDPQDEGDPADTVYNVAGRDSITAADTVFATYAIDPKTSGDQPRAILKNSDLIKISIEDKGRDKRTGQLYIVSDSETVPTLPDNGGAGILDDAQTGIILGALGDDLTAELYEAGDYDTDPATPDTNRVKLSNNTAFFDRLQVTTAQRTISTSGDAQFRLTGTGSTESPMAPKDDGKVYWFGNVNTDDGTSAFSNLAQYIELDEDLNTGEAADLAPWMRVTASLPANVTIDVLYIYYQTSDQEEIVGGKRVGDYDGVGGNPESAVSPVFTDDESGADPDALVLRVSSDGIQPNQNLWLKETSRFSGFYEGYARLTDADGDGRCVDADNDSACDDGEDDFGQARNWGLELQNASSAGADDYAVIAVESGPVSVTYKNSNGDTRTLSISIDRDAPAIQVDAPIHNTASTDVAPDVIGTFADVGGAGLREDSFKVYADNRDDGHDDNAIWDLGVNGAIAADDPERSDRGQVCVDALTGSGDSATAGSDGICDVAGESSTSLRSQYLGYAEANSNGTYGIIYSHNIYLPTVDDEDNKNYDTAVAEEFEDGATEGEFDSLVRIDFEPPDDRRYNNTIDIQAVVIDIAGNIGFSDADPSSPTFVDDLNTAPGDRDDIGTHNVIGIFSRHLYLLDDVDPAYEEDQSATGFFVDADGDVTRTSSGLMVVFDGPLDPATVGIGTFAVELDNGSDATVVDAVVDKAKVYLLLEEELAPDSTPSVDLASGQSVADLAGNESTDRRLDGIELSDGILPTFTVSLSGGTGLNEDIDGEGPSELTKGQMKISISANEAIQGAPQFSVVCNNLHWDGDMEDTSPAKFASNRTGPFTADGIKDAAPNEAKHTAGGSHADNSSDVWTMCRDHEKAAVEDGASATYFDVARTNAHRRAGNNWEYDWSNLGADQELEDGTLTVIVWGRDRSSYENAKGERLLNYSASSVNFVYDTELMAAWDDEDGLVPDEGDNVFETRPFVLLDFGSEGTTVNVTLFEVDGVDHTAELQILEDSEFVWWPEPLAYGTYTVYVEANDAANNEGDHEYSFTVKERAPFVLDLLAGWNSISFPANPIDRALHAVFTDPAIDQVIGWDATETVSPWRMASRVDGVWTTSEDVATLNDVEARYGYWVHSTGFITQAVALAGKGDRSTDGQPNPADIPTDEGWNFVGVVDVDGDQTQDDANETLRNSNNDPITAAEYLGNYTRAYTWDHINNTWDVLKNDEGIVIGTGIWVYYTKGHDIAP